MFNYLIQAISRALSFSKAEAKGTIVLIFIIFCSIIITKLKINSLHRTTVVAQDSVTLAWILHVDSSYELKKHAKPTFDKSVYQPTKKYLRAEKSIFRKPNKSAPTTSGKKEAVIVIKDLNLATAEELQSVKGIGPAFSERIVKYRNMLGGFADSVQLKEVYGLQPETIVELNRHFVIQSDVTPIDINSDSLKVLASHPYISYDLARIILNFRQQHGDFETAEDLQKIKAIDERTFLRLKPYLK